MVHKRTIKENLTKCQSSF